MRIDTVRGLLSYLIAILVLVGTFYGLVIYPFELDPLVQGALIGAATAAYTFAFGQEIAKQTAAASQKAYDKGVATPTPTVTVQGGDAPSVTVEPQSPVTDVGG